MLTDFEKNQLIVRLTEFTDNGEISWVVDTDGKFKASEGGFTYALNIKPPSLTISDETNLVIDGKLPLHLSSLDALHAAICYQFARAYLAS